MGQGNESTSKLEYNVKALIQAEPQDSKADDRAPEADDKAAGKRPVV